MAKLTPKQQHFARCVSQGMSQSQAYREAYDAEQMSPRAIHSEAHKLAKHPEIARRIEVLIQQKEQMAHRSALADRERVQTKLRAWLEGTEEATTTQLRSAELLGKAVGLYRDVVEDHRTPVQETAEDLEQALEEKLEQLLSEQSVPEVEEGTEQEPPASYH